MIQEEVIGKRKSDWIQTYSGYTFWPMDPEPDAISIQDIAHSLSLQCRFSGHCKEFYSVAQHSVLVSRLVPKEFKLWGLLHDASEAYICDIPRPIKPFLKGYKEIEHNIMTVIAYKFGLPLEMPPEVRKADTAILADEAAQIMSKAQDEWYLPEPPTGIKIEPWTPETAKRIFLEEFRACQKM